MAAKESIDFVSARSTWRNTALAPPLVSASTVASPQSARTSATTIRSAPASAQAAANARPSPRPAPVMRIVRPSRLMCRASCSLDRMPRSLERLELGLRLGPEDAAQTRETHVVLIEELALVGAKLELL